MDFSHSKNKPTLNKAKKARNITVLLANPLNTLHVRKGNSNTNSISKIRKINPTKIKWIEYLTRLSSKLKNPHSNGDCFSSSTFCFSEIRNITSQMISLNKILIVPQISKTLISII